MTQKKEPRAVFLSFEFEKDYQRWKSFLGDGKERCKFALVDRSLPAAVHDDKWRKEVKQRMQKSDVVIVLLGQDTHNAPGVEIELSLAGEVKCPVVQLRPQGKNYGLVAGSQAVCVSKWTRINEMLRDPKAYVANRANWSK